MEAPLYRPERIIRTAKPDLDKIAREEEDRVLALLVIRQRYLKENDNA